MDLAQVFMREMVAIAGYAVMILTLVKVFQLSKEIGEIKDLLQKIDLRKPMGSFAGRGDGEKTRGLDPSSDSYAEFVVRQAAEAREPAGATLTGATLAGLAGLSSTVNEFREVAAEDVAPVESVAAFLSGRTARTTSAASVIESDPRASSVISPVSSVQSTSQNGAQGISQAPSPAATIKMAAAETGLSAAQLEPTAAALRSNLRADLQRNLGTPAPRVHIAPPPPAAGPAPTQTSEAATQEIPLLNFEPAGAKNNDLKSDLPAL